MANGEAEPTPTQQYNAIIARLTTLATRLDTIEGKIDDVKTVVDTINSNNPGA